jgi:hypothetical protein
LRVLHAARQPLPAVVRARPFQVGRAPRHPGADLRRPRSGVQVRSMGTREVAKRAGLGQDQGPGGAPVARGVGRPVDRPLQPRPLRGQIQGGVREGAAIGRVVHGALRRRRRLQARERHPRSPHGGDEFLVMLPGASLPEAHRFFERMRDQVAERSERTLGFELRLSAGAVQCPGYARDPATLLDAADEAMYRAKRRGKNRLFATLSLATPAERRRTSSPEE